MHPLWALALVTFVCVMAFLVWNLASLKRHRQLGANATGVGGLSDPMSGTTEGMRDPDEMRSAMDAAASRPLTERPR